jgi:pilus assembly protein FimV
MTRGQGDEWAQAAALGLSIDPLNPLYATAGAQPDAVPEPGEQAQTLSSRDFDDVFAAADMTAAPSDATPAAAPAAAMAQEPMSFDQHFADAMGTAQPQAAAFDAASAATPAPAAAEDENTLDFDLGGLAFEPVQAEQPKPAEAAHDDNLLDFDMGGFDAAPVVEPVEPLAAPAEAAESFEAAAPAAAEEPLDFSFDMDFGAAAPNPVPQPVAPTLDSVDDLTFGDFDLGDAVPGAAPAAEAPAEFANSDFDMANLAKEFDLPALPSAPEPVAAEPVATEPAAAAAGSLATDMEDPLFDLDTMDFGLPTATPAPVETAEYAPHDMLEPAKVEPSFDLGGFDLDLPGENAQTLPAFETVTADAAPAEMSAAHMEMETKLDLAIAYQEIGDKEGARELLEEVIKGGNSDQVSKANAMRAQLA